jgi:hypothetical protein
MAFLNYGNLYGKATATINTAGWILSAGARLVGATRTPPPLPAIEHHLRARSNAPTFTEQELAQDARRQHEAGGHISLWHVDFSMATPASSETIRQQAMTPGRASAHDDYEDIIQLIAHSEAHLVNHTAAPKNHASGSQSEFRENAVRVWAELVKDRSHTLCLRIDFVGETPMLGHEQSKLAHKRPSMMVAYQIVTHEWCKQSKTELQAELAKPDQWERLPSAVADVERWRLWMEEVKPLLQTEPVYRTSSVEKHPVD